MDQEINLNWKDIDNGQTIGEIGSENGKIIYDVENIKGARISIEKDTDIAPFAITIGVYGIMFHTHFASTEDESKDFVSESKKRIESLFQHLEIAEHKQDENWRKSFNDLVEKIAE